jgi:hypothetical protein
MKQTSNINPHRLTSNPVDSYRPASNHIESHQPPSAPAVDSRRIPPIYIDPHQTPSPPIDLFTLKQAVFEMATVGATAACRQINPASDELSYSEACRIAGGRHWIDGRVKQQLLLPYKKEPGKAKNAKLYFSRTEIVSLKTAERLAQLLHK